ncbi:hypothetical protein [Cytobacillus sp. IB215316]|uniref:hypothetical protein n=1 Tax=Cytobacillus sp. IB215316 TaxID=3097354 RepID=UPI002A136D9C|nr:hypothetical protein [Cytobacillus sp. IB215316]MDX8360168.1 hypothetical protein [Cytobacillus sp. IB215316]
MKAENVNELLTQINIALPLIRSNYEAQPTQMLELILQRYEAAKEILESKPASNIAKDMFEITGGARAYLESANDYLNPMLEELYKCEELIDAAD